MELLNTIINFVSVRGTFQRATAPGIYMVRGFTRIQKKKYGVTDTRNRQDRNPVSILFYRLYNRTPFRYWTDNEETLHQVHLSLRILFHIFM